MEKLSVMIPCFNSERTIRSALESVKWADEIVVVDSYSTDKTLEICRGYTDRILQHPYVNSAAQKNWALPQCQYPWILQIDSDEQLEPELKDEIRAVLLNPHPDFDCYQMRRKNFMYGKWLKGGLNYPDHQVRLFRRSSGSWEDKWLHAMLVTKGKCGTFKHHLIQDDFKGISAYLLKLERYMRYECQELLKRNARVHWYDLYLRPFLVFFHRFLLTGGFWDGWGGYLHANLVAWQVFIKYARLWESEWELKKKK